MRGKSGGCVLKLPAGISLDLDNQWSYMKIHGDQGWNEYPSYLGIFIPHVLKVLDELNLRITFFIVGQDAALKKNREMLHLITERGHSVGNHSFSHDSWLHLLPEEKVAAEINDTHDLIASVTGQEPIGFRGPGFCRSDAILNMLIERGYRYDASILPTWLGPLGRLYYFWKSDLTREEKKQRKELFGKFSDGKLSIKAFTCVLASGKSIVEIPVSTIPLFKVPFHLSYLLYLSRFSSALMHAYLTVAIMMCKITRTSPSFLLHPLDLIGGDQLQALKFFPGMDLSSAQKTKVFASVIRRLQADFDLMDLNSFADRVSNTKKVLLTPPKTK
jgi:peptidoglycan-N-acetylglucosamine deacetylase